MSGTLAIAAVSAVMKYLLINSLTDYGVAGSVGDVRVSALAPDLVGDDEPHLNLFFMHASRNPGWAQHGLPTRTGSGTPVARPYLALDLHYLISAHGLSDFQAEIILGYAMQVFHEHAILSPPTIRTALTSGALVTVETPAPMIAAIAAANLAEQVEQIRIAMDPPGLEAISQTWSALQANYRPTAAYTVSVVLIESRTEARSSLPVRGYNVYAPPFRQPVITAVLAEDGPGSPMTMGTRVLVRGLHLRGEETTVRVAGVEIPQADLTIRDTEVGFDLPPAARAGIQGVQVVHYLQMGTPPARHQGFESNVAAFVLQPAIRTSGGAYLIQQLAAGGDLPKRLRVTLDPTVDASQRAALLLNEFDPPSTRPARAYAVEAVPRLPDSAAVNELDFPIPQVAAGAYVVRVRIDGAESPLEFALPDGYSRPRITVT